MLPFIQNLRDAPVMNLFVLVGFLLVVFAAAGRTPLGRTDPIGRILSSFCGVALLAAATVMFLGIRSARDAPIEDRTPPNGARLAAEPRPAPPIFPAPAPPAPHPTAAPAGRLTAAPSTAPSRSAAAAMARPAPAPTPVEGPALMNRVSLPPVEERGEWGCEETRTLTAAVKIPAGAQFRSAIVETVEVDRAKALQRFEPRYDESTRTVSGAVVFQGLDRVLFNCPGGGHATIRLTVTAAVP